MSKLVVEGHLCFNEYFFLACLLLELGHRRDALRHTHTNISSTRLNVSGLWSVNFPQTGFEVFPVFVVSPCVIQSSTVHFDVVIAA